MIHRHPYWSVSVEDCGDYWIATHPHDVTGAGIIQLKFMKTEWHRDDICGAVLEAARQARLSVNPPPPVWELFHKRSYAKTEKWKAARGSMTKENIQTQGR